MAAFAKWRSKGHGLRTLLALAWMPYLTLPCLSCPQAQTRLLRCAARASAASGEQLGFSHHHEHHPDGAVDHRVALGGDVAGQRHHEHAPGGDCCSYRQDRTTVGSTPEVVAPPSTAVTVLPLLDLAPRSISSRTGTFFPEPNQNSPPIFLATLVLLL